MNDGSSVCRVYRGSKAPRRRTGASARSAYRSVWGREARGRGLRYAIAMLAQLRNGTLDSDFLRSHVFRERVIARATRRVKASCDVRRAAR